MPHLIDSHCHLHDRSTYKFALSRQKKQTIEDFSPEKVLSRMEENGVKQAICIGTTHEDSLAARAFAEKYDNLFYSYGIHPEEANPGGSWQADSEWQDVADLLFFESERMPRATEPVARERVARKDGPTSGRERQKIKIRPGEADNSDPVREKPSLLAIQANAPVAIGEVGLDYHSENYDRAAQIALFEQMLDLATKNDLPLIFHIRDAFDDFFAVLDNFRAHKISGVVHSFSDSQENLERSLSRDFYIGVNGLATFVNLPLPPLERTLLETDSPFLAPVPYRGRVNDPSHIKDIALWLAEKQGTTLEDVAKITTENAKTLFRLPPSE